MSKSKEFHDVHNIQHVDMSYVDQNRRWFSDKLMFVIGSSIKVKKNIYFYH